MVVGAGRERVVRRVDMRVGGMGGGRWDWGEAMACWRLESCDFGLLEEKRCVDVL